MKTPVTRLSRIVSLTALALAPFAAAAAAAFVATAGTASAAPTGASLAAAPAPPPHTLAELATRFTAPPDEYKPRVWWHWMGPNFTKTGITKDLEAMREAGIGGAVIFNIASSVQSSHAPMGNLPWPEQTYRGPAYWDAFRHTLAEAERLGLKIGIHGTPGYATTGGPWVPEEKAMQTLVITKTVRDGGALVEVALPRPVLPTYYGYETHHPDYSGTPRQATYYRDVAVIAVPEKENPGIYDVLDISAQMDAAGNLRWQAPAGKWHIYRMGHAPTMANPHPLPDDIIGRSLEVDKMDREANIWHWQQLLGPIQQHAAGHIGKTLELIWVDSYEAGDQNWTPKMRTEFIKQKGYDPVPWLALQQYATGDRVTRLRKIGPLGTLALDVPKRPDLASFVKDYRSVCHRLIHENSWEISRQMLNNAGLKFFWEPYDGPFDTTLGTPLADVPCDEFWSHDTGGVWHRDSLVPAAAAANRRIVGAEALTGRPIYSRYTEDPAFLKAATDNAYATGANLFFLHHWVHQPFDDKHQPGLGMGWWGTHFGRHQTWFRPGKAFFTYLARCQMLLQQGSFVELLHGAAHRRTPEGDIFFVKNSAAQPRAQVHFAGVAGRVPELWDAYTGTITAAPAWRERDGGVEVTLNLGQYQSVFVVFPWQKTPYAKAPIRVVTAETAVPVASPWQVAFQPKLDAPFARTLPALIDFGKQTDPALRYFSGTAAYRKTLDISAADLASGKRIVLDLGELHDIAELEINGVPAGVLWNPPYKSDITAHLHSGANELVVRVTNNWANRLIGDEQFPADFEWGSDRGEQGRAVKSYPDWFIKNTPRPSAGRKTFNIWYYYRKDSPLQPAGLLGPVRLLKQDAK